MNNATDASSNCSVIVLWTLIYWILILFNSELSIFFFVLNDRYTLHAVFRFIIIHPFQLSGCFNINYYFQLNCVFCQLVQRNVVQSVLPQLGNKQSPSIWKTLLRRGTENGEQGTSTEKDKWKIKSKVNKANLNSSAISKFLYYALFCSHLSFPVSRVTFPSKITTSK